MTGQELPYDPTDAESIAAYAGKLVGKRFRDAVGTQLGAGKGNLGQLLERGYFLYEPNSRAGPDFEKAKLELKTAPLKALKKGTRSPKERIVLNIIDFNALSAEEWESSGFLSKNRNLLLIFYLHEQGKDPLEFTIERVVVWRFDEQSLSDQSIIKDDWQLIADKVRRGESKNLSESDTLYLGACTKGTDSSVLRSAPGGDAKQRAFSLKAQYVRSILSKDLDVKELFPGGTSDFHEAVAGKFLPYLGQSSTDLARRFNISTERRPKSFFAMISRRIIERILGGDPEQFSEFRKAGVTVKTIHMNAHGTVKENISFPYIRFDELAQEEWESSQLYELLTGKFLFVVFHDDLEGNIFLSDAFLWSMPAADLEAAHQVWKKTKEKVLLHLTDELPGMKENPIVHVRPHAQRKSDTTPDLLGNPARKQGFWIGAKYVKRVIDAHREERRTKPRE